MHSFLFFGVLQIQQEQNRREQKRREEPKKRAFRLFFFEEEWTECDAFTKNANPSNAFSLEQVGVVKALRKCTVNTPKCTLY